jgi:hypothetical protein
MKEMLKPHGEHRCPTCQREIYSRRRTTCEFCGAELPEEIRLSPEEIQAVKEEIREIHDRHERAKEEEEEERANAPRPVPIVPFIPPIH